MSLTVTIKYSCSWFQNTLAKLEIKRPVNWQDWDLCHLSSVWNPSVVLARKFLNVSFQRMKQQGKWSLARLSVVRQSKLMLWDLISKRAQDRLLPQQRLAKNLNRVFNRLLQTWDPSEENFINKSWRQESPIHLLFQSWSTRKPYSSLPSCGSVGGIWAS